MKQKIYFVKIIALVVLCLCSSLGSVSEAQGPHRRCATNEPSYVEAALANAWLASTKDMRAADSQPIEVPVAFHVIQDSAGSNTTTVEQLREQISVLNAGFSGAFVFSLGSVDTVVNDEWFACQARSTAYNEMVKSLRVGDARTLNVYLCDLYIVSRGDGVGFSNIPWMFPSNPEPDGVSIFFGALPGGSSERLKQGKTLVHETGHWLGLLHTFQRPKFFRPLSARNNGCVGRGDFISDTPAEKKPHYSCARRVDSCPAKGFDPLNNYMSYADDYCLEKFTPKQSARMRAVWEAYRARG